MVVGGGHEGRRRVFQRRERDVHGGYSRREGGQPVVTLVTSGGASGGKTGEVVVGSGERERTKGSVGWEEKQVGEAGFRQLLA